MRLGCVAIDGAGFAQMLARALRRGGDVGEVLGAVISLSQRGDEDLELRVQHRMQRRCILEKERPVPYEVLVHEAALRMRVGGRTAARAQLARVLELSEADHITVRVIPFDLEDFADLGSAMVYAGGAVPKLDTVVRDGPHGTGFIDSEAQLNVFRTHFRRVEAVSLAPERSRDFIHRLSKEL